MHSTTKWSFACIDMESYFKGYEFLSFTAEITDDRLFFEVESFMKNLSQKYAVEYLLSRNQQRRKISSCINNPVFMISCVSSIIDDLPLPFEACDIHHFKKSIVIDIILKRVRY